MNSRKHSKYLSIKVGNCQIYVSVKAVYKATINQLLKIHHVESTEGDETTHLQCPAQPTSLDQHTANLLTHLCLVFHYWNAKLVGLIYILQFKVIAKV